MLRIHSIQLQNVRGIRRLDITNLPDTGVVVIHGNNEAGKSTIMDALHACLNYKYTSIAQEIRSLVPYDRVGWPEIRLGLTIGSNHFELYKEFNDKKKSGKCVLQYLDEKKLTLYNDEAENKLQTLINEYLDTKLLDTLFVRQGKLTHSLAVAGIPSVEKSLHSGVVNDADDSAADARNLDSVSGTSSGVEDAQEESRLLAAVNAEYARYYTDKTGKPAKELKTAEERLADSQEQQDEAKAQLEKVSEYVTEYEELSEREKQAADEIPEAEKELAAAETTKKNAQTVYQRFDDAAEAVGRAATQKNLETKLLEERSGLVDELKQELARRDELTRQLGEAEDAAQREAELIAELRAAQRRADADYRKQRERQKIAREAARELHNAQRAHELRELVNKVTAIDAEIGAVREQIAALPSYIDKDAWHHLRELHDDVVVEQKLAVAHSARLELRAESPQTVVVNDGTGSREICLGQDSHAEEVDEAITLADGTALRFGDITAVYRSAQQERTGDDSPVSALEQARQRLEEELAVLHCSDIAHAEQVYMKCNNVDEKITALRNRRAGVVGDKDIESVKQELSDLPQHEGGSDIGDADEIAAELSAAEAAEEQARQRLEVSAGKLAAYDGRPAESAALRVQERRSLAEERVHEAEVKVADRADAAAMEKLRENVELATRKWEQAIAERDIAQAAVDEVDLPMAVRNWEGAQAHLNQLQNTVREAENRKLALSSHIEAATGAAERLQKAQAHLENHRADYAVVDRRAQAAARLRETLLQHREAARLRYMKPFARELERFAQVVFGQSVSFELDESLAISKRTIGGAALETEHLSGGAQEQLALLIRFAVAALTARGHQSSADTNKLLATDTLSDTDTLPAIPVPVMVDDALGSTDAHRLKLMATLFSEIGRQTQVFVLTCMPERYSRVVGARRYSMRELTSN